MNRALKANQEALQALAELNTDQANTRPSPIQSQGSASHSIQKVKGDKSVAAKDSYKETTKAQNVAGTRDTKGRDALQQRTLLALRDFTASNQFYVENGGEDITLPIRDTLAQMPPDELDRRIAQAHRRAGGFTPDSPGVTTTKPPTKGTATRNNLSLIHI